MMQNLTPPVNIFPWGAQLQDFKFYKKGKEGLCFFSFYPPPTDLCWGAWGTSWPEAFVSGLKKAQFLEAGFAIQPDPLQLYLRAHFKGQRLKSVELLQGVLVLAFSGADPEAACVLKIERGSVGSFKVCCQVPGRKDFKRDLLLSAHSFEGRAPDERAEAAAVKTLSRESQKQERLRANVQADLQQAQRDEHLYQRLCAKIQEDPQAWGLPEAWDLDEQALLELLFVDGKLPSFRVEFRKEAQEKLFSLKKKSTQRVLGAQKRWQSLGGPSEAKRSAVGGRLASVGNEADAGPAKPSRKPGLWILLPGDIWARLGRSATENAELFRQAKDRDLWFHVRGQSGSHVWIPRGQKGLGAKEEPRQELMEWGAQVALINSRAAKSGFAVVDVTERKDLRSIAGEPGTLKILRSRTLSTHLDEAFERKLRGK